MNEIDAIQLYQKQEQRAKDIGLSLDMLGSSIQISLGDYFLLTVSSVKELTVFIEGYTIGKTGDMPTQHDSI